MKSLTSAAIVAITAAVIGSAGLTTTASAQQQPPMQPNMQPHMQMPGGQGFGFNQHRRDGQFRQFGNGQHRNNMRAPDQGGIRAGALLDLVCSGRGAEALEVGLVRMSYRLDLTDAQKPLFDDLRTTALTAQTGFSDQCSTARPAKAADGAQPTPPTPVERINATIAIEKARLAALETVLPKFEAFYNSLTADQQAQLDPRKGRGGPNMPMQPGQMPMPGEPGAPPAPGGENAPAPTNG